MFTRRIIYFQYYNILKKSLHLINMLLLMSLENARIRMNQKQPTFPNTFTALLMLIADTHSVFSKRFWDKRQAEGKNSNWCVLKTVQRNYIFAINRRDKFNRCDKFNRRDKFNRCADLNNKFDFLLVNANVCFDITPNITEYIN